ncbi:MAG: hypothetical protein M3Z92_08670 [Bacteroidota bacterium]|nr:hypothetical protein [Bacteroidota bacterium]MDQ6888666.1 hypothetical protein [Bacteroidota bacterium]
MNADMKAVTLNTILEELNDVPVDKLRELHAYINSLKANTEKSEDKRKEILSFAGIFNDMSQNDYDDFLKETKKTRGELFDREINL